MAKKNGAGSRSPVRAATQSKSPLQAKGNQIAAAQGFFLLLFDRMSSRASVMIIL